MRLWALDVLPDLIWHAQTQWRRDRSKESSVLKPSPSITNGIPDVEEDWQGRITTPRTLLPNLESKSRAQSRSNGSLKDPQGLAVLYEPAETRLADIIFVHGLGGSSVSTWTKDGDEQTFWPKRFLPLETGLSQSRILSFGYPACFLSRNASKQVSILDFARSLLGCLQSEGDLGFGQASTSIRVSPFYHSDSNQVPIIFIAHSLGGLVVKKVVNLISIR